MESTNKMEQYMQSHPPIIPQSYPWLVIRDGKHLERQKIFNISKDKYYSITIPEMHNKMICTSTNEWLLLNDLDSKDLSLLNLHSMEVLQLPRLESFTDSDVCILSPPTSESNQDYYVMIIHCSPSRFYFCQPGDEEFSEQVFEFDLEEQDDEFGAMWISAATMFRGKVYFLTTFSRIDPVSVSVLFTAEFVGSNLHFTRITMEGFPQPSPLEIPTTNDYLIESGGELLYICKMRGGWDAKMILGFIILRMNFLRQAWEEVNNIGGWTLFLSQDRGLEHKAISCFAAEEGVKQNSIYFTKPFDRFYYVFDLENNSISKSLPCPIVSKFMSRLDWVLIPVTKS
ncbi:uncharacterized protein LOC112026406 [Quercus suber]|uniref:uncharacterized protein LOC112026406 n=1 Tax=Quercus suber TaxID=58331 RepID=UPI0032DF0A72